MKRMLALALCLLMCPAALAETFTVTWYGSEEDPGYSLLLKDDGTALTPPGEYASLFELTPDNTPEADRRYAAQTMTLPPDVASRQADDEGYMDYERVALMDGAGKLLTGFDYSYLTWRGDGYIDCSIPGDERAFSGILDADGHVLVEPKYYAVAPFGNGRYLALKRAESGQITDDGEGRCAVLIVDEDGAEAETGLHTLCGYLSSGVSAPCPVSDVEEYDGKTVFVDSDGAVCFDRSFDEAGEFEGDFAIVRVRRFTGLIDREGAFVIEPEFDYLRRDGDLYIGEQGSTIAVFSAETGEPLMRETFADTGEVYAYLAAPGLLWVNTDGGHCFYTTDGQRLAELKDNESSYFTCVKCAADALRVIENSGEWPYDVSRLVDGEGNALSADYWNIYEADTRDGGMLFVTVECPIVKNSDGEPTVYYEGIRFGLMDADGRELMPPTYTSLDVLSADRFWVSAPGKTGMVDLEGNWYYAISEYEMLMD